MRGLITGLAVAMTLGIVACRGKPDLADVYVQQGRWGEAARLYREHLAQNPDDQLALRSLAALECYRLGQLEECAKTAEHLLSLMPIDSDGVAAVAYARTLLAERATRKNDTAQVRVEMMKIGEAYFKAGYWEYMRENFQRSERFLRKAVLVDPNRADAYLRLGILFWNRHQTDSSLAWFARAERVAPMNEDALVNQIVVLWQANRIEEAKAVLNRLNLVRAQLYPDSSFASPVDTSLPPLSLDFRGDVIEQKKHLITF